MRNDRPQRAGGFFLHTCLKQLGRRVRDERQVGDPAMLLTITTTHRPAHDLGYLLHKHPERFQSFDLSFGKAHVYYPEVGVERCTACLLLDVDSVGMVRGKNPDQSFLLAQYVNDRPYTASSF